MMVTSSSCRDLVHIEDIEWEVNGGHTGDAGLGHVDNLEEINGGDDEVVEQDTSKRESI